jgi:hypothetical protein
VEAFGLWNSPNIKDRSHGMKTSRKKGKKESLIAQALLDFLWS